MSKHDKFIITSISTILEEALIASSTLSKGIESFPLSDYFMQATFLKLTGASEQKLKCILWELATDDYEFRKDFLKNDYGECSNYSSKSKVVRDIIDCINRKKSDYQLTNSDKTVILDYANEKTKLFNNVLLVNWFSKNYSEYNSIISNISTNQLIISNAKQNNLFKKGSELEKIFDLMYRHRNRCAHNLQSYQDNLPTLMKLRSEEYKYENWFVRYYILFLIDEIFIFLYKEYMNVREIYT